MFPDQIRIYYRFQRFQDPALHTAPGNSRQRVLASLHARIPAEDPELKNPEILPISGRII
jgi:hypothetical protein